ncbi:MAG: helix-turn-helix transcriptional regulator [Bacillaceae bacterium]
MEQLLKLTAVLSDPTRFSIYQHIANTNQQVTVLEIAEQFSIHPNVARLHLSKLDNCKLLQSVLQKNTKGGRPCRLYSLSDKAVNLTFPFRDYPLLSTLAIDALLDLGDVGKEALYKMGIKYGKKMVYTCTNDALLKEMTLAQKVELLEQTTVFTGLNATFQLEADNKLAYTVHNCPFKEMIMEDEAHRQAICQMHNGIFEGLTTTIFQESNLVQLQSMNNSCKTCKYELNC